MIERVLFATDSSGHSHSHGEKVFVMPSVKNQTNTESAEKNVTNNMVLPKSENDKEGVRRRSSRRFSVVDLVKYMQNFELSVSSKKALSSVVLAIVLTIHSIFEGVVIGLQKSPTSVWIISAAVTGHKIFESTSLGANFAKKDVNKKKTIFWVILFSIGNPLGIMTGIFLSTTNDIVAGCLNALSTGTFLYITLTEIVPDEFNNKDRWLKFFC